MSDMGAAQSFRQSPTGERPIVAFDFDGTLTIRDSFTAFLRWRAGAAGWAIGLAKMAPALAAYISDRDRGRIKAASVREFLHGVERATLEAEAERYADQVWDRFMRPDALACWKAWGEKGAHRVIVTASPETTVAPSPAAWAPRACWAHSWCSTPRTASPAPLRVRTAEAKRRCAACAPPMATT